MAYEKARSLCTWALFLFAAQADCADGPEVASTARAATVNACSLLSPPQISRAVGLPVDAGVRRDEGYQENGSYSSACVWTIRRNGATPANPAAPLGGKSFVILNVIQWPAGSGLARTYLEDFRAASASGVIAGKPIPRSFGDEALWWGDGLAVRRRDVSFGVSVFTPGMAARRLGEREEQLAPYILRQLDERDAH